MLNPFETRDAGRTRGGTIFLYCVIKQMIVPRFVVDFGGEEELPVDHEVTKDSPGFDRLYIVGWGDQETMFARARGHIIRKHFIEEEPIFVKYKRADDNYFLWGWATDRMSSMKHAFHGYAIDVVYWGNERASRHFVNDVRGLGYDIITETHISEMLYFEITGVGIEHVPGDHQ